ncbi:sensor histidine kinase [Chloroflexota bacterium]
MRSLRWKLGGSLLLVVIFSLGLMAFLTTVSTHREFQAYVTTSRASIILGDLVDNTLGKYYVNNDGWDGIQSIITQVPRQRTDRLVLANASNTIVADTSTEWLGFTADNPTLGPGIPINVDSKKVGTLYLLSTSGAAGRGRMMDRAALNQTLINISPALEAAESNFNERINRSLIMAGLASAGIALLLGLLLTQQITRPLKALREGAKKVASGYFGIKVKVKARDELGDLADSFNAMSGSLEESEASRQRLLDDVSHELRTPLTVIEGTVSGMIDGVFPSDAEHLESIREQTELLTRLIRDMKDISNAESGHLVLELANTDVTGLLRRKAAQAEVSARKKNISITLKLQESLPEISIDAARIEQVLANLLTNAIRHAPEGSEISVVAMKDTLPTATGTKEPRVVISVADRGEGIAPEDQEPIFDRFYRVEHSRARSEGGTGLGLAIVRQMVEAHGGSIWVESSPGNGSTFSFSLPFVPEAT